MRIAIANAFGHLVGGSESYVRGLVPALRARGHAVSFLHEMPVASAQPPLEFDGVPTWCARALGASATTGELARWRPDVALVNGNIDPTLERGILATAPAVVFVHDYRGACATGEKRRGYSAASPCTRPLGPGCIALNYLCGCGARNPVALVRNYRLQVERRELLGHYRFVLVASAHMREEMVRNSVPPHRVVVNPLWPSSVPPDPFAPLARPQTGRIAFLGRLTHVKGASHAAEAVAMAARLMDRELVLRVGGEGPELARLERRRASGERVELLGWVDGGPRRALLVDADLVVVPSLWPEPFGLVGLEAACVGTPAAAYDVGGVREWLVPGRTGEVAHPWSTRALAEAIVRCLGDAAHHQLLRVGAWNHARGFRVEDHVRVLEEVMERVTAQDRSRA